MRVAKALEWQRSFIEQCRKKGVACEIDLEVNPKIEGDPEKLKQLFLNLAINALDATDTGGSVKIRSALEKTGRGGERVRVDVIDTGKGMDRQTAGRVFDPFFTTKNEGTGLGLSIAYSIVEQHGGSIDVQTAPGKGTTFGVSLPVHEDEETVGQRGEDG
jgi:signal transduction histidine kinase